MKFPLILLAVVLAGCSVRSDNTVKSPDSTDQYGVFGTVHVQYDVNKDGHIENIVVQDDEGDLLTKQILSAMKQWRLEKDHPMKAQKLTIAVERDSARAKRGFIEN
jgi:outer membrane biosynthesis protein TonB